MKADKIRIVKCSNPEVWYANNIGSTYAVSGFKDMNGDYKLLNEDVYVNGADCIGIPDLRIEALSKLDTPPIAFLCETFTDFTLVNDILKADLYSDDWEDYKESSAISYYNGASGYDTVKFYEAPKWLILLASDLITANLPELQDYKLHPAIEHISSIAPLSPDTVAAINKMVEIAQTKKFRPAHMDESETKDNLFQDAWDIILKNGSLGKNIIQRKLKLGFNRAERLHEELKYGNY